MTQVAKLDIPGDTFNISGRENEKGTTQGDDDTEALLLDGESHDNDDKSSRVVEGEVIQSQNVGAEEEEEEDGENESEDENDERQEDVNPTSNNTDDTTSLLVGAEESQRVGQEVSEREVDEENGSVVGNEDQGHDLKPASENEEIFPDPSAIPASSDDSFSD